MVQFGVWDGDQGKKEEWCGILSHSRLTNRNILIKEKIGENFIGIWEHVEAMYHLKLSSNDNESQGFGENK